MQGVEGGTRKTPGTGRYCHRPGTARDGAMEGSRGLHRGVNPGVHDSTAWLSPHHAGLWSVPATVSQTQAPGKACLETSG